MRAKIKGFSSPDIEDFHSFTPENLENFSFLFEFMVGPENENGEEIFAIQVCTPQWLLSRLKKDDILLGRHFLIVLEYNFERIFNKIKQLIEACSGDTWNEVAEKVGRIGYWEFEDY